MKTLTEVCEAIGVTQSALQGYDEIGLLHPSVKNADYWLYNDVAVTKLLLIQVLVEAGYERMDIKTILEDSQFDWERPFDQLIDILSKKKDRLQGLINTIKIMNMGIQVPESAAKVFSDIDITVDLQKKSLAEFLDESSNATAGFDDIDSEEARQWVPFWTLLSMFGYYRNADVASTEVQACVKSIYDWFNSMKPTSAEEFSEEMMEIIADREISTMLDEQIGEGTARFIREAVRTYRKDNGTDKGDTVNWPFYRKSQSQVGCNLCVDR